MASQADLLASCLKFAVAEGDLEQDIIEACRLSNTSVSDLAGWSLEDIASKLFLTEGEASKLSGVCKAVNAGDLSMLEGKMVAAPKTAGSPPARAAREQRAAAQQKTPEPKAPYSNGHSSPAQPTAQTPPQSADPVPRTKKAKADPKLTASQGLRSSQKLTASQQLRSSHAPLVSESSYDEEAIAKMPSYLRPTTSARARSAANPERSPSPDLPSRPTSAKKVNTASSRLLAPTASYLTRINSARKESKAAREAAEAAEKEAKRKELLKVMQSPQGQRVTKAEPFRFRTPQESTMGRQLTTEERAFLEEQKHAYKRHTVPKHVHESRSIEGVYTHSTPKSPEEIFKPFQLASLDKHEQYREMMQKRLREEKKKAEALKRFHAQELDKKMLVEPEAPPPRTPQPVTRPQEYKFSSEERVKLHKEVLDPARRSRMTQAEREKLEAHERATREEEMRQQEAKAATAAERQREKELMSMDISEYRKSLTFKAGQMPNFKSPYRPDMSKSQSVTQSIDFNFKTYEKLGKPKALYEREDAAGAHLPGGSFTSSLRNSTDRLSMNGSRNSMRASTNSLRASTNSMAAMRASTNSMPLSAQKRPASARPASARPKSAKMQPRSVEAH